MAYTDHSDIYGAVHEKGINLFVQHLQRQRPSMFNYGSPNVVANPDLWCVPIEAAPGVTPLMATEQPIPILGTNGLVGMDFCAQLVKLEVDLHPGGVFAQPPELGELDEQAFAVHAHFCAGLGCPTQKLEGIDLPDPKDRNEVVIPTRRLECFCLELFVEGRVAVEEVGGESTIQGHLEGLEIVDIRPEGLENSMECYLATLVEVVLLPQAATSLPTIALDILDLATIELGASTTVPHNPSIHDDQLHAYIDFTVTGPTP